VRIALLEDDSAQADLIQSWLTGADYQCRHSASGEAFMKLLCHETFDLLMIDWNLPGISGIDVLQRVRNELDWPIPVIFTTSRISENDIVRALELGADDYMFKPIKQAEMLARIKALTRRSQLQEKEAKLFDFGIFQVNDESHVVTRLGEPIELTIKEYQLVLFLFKNAGRLISRGHLLESVWGQNSNTMTRTVDTHISRIRQKLQLGHASDWRLITVYQHGYRLEKMTET
jgi:DNA-binding response OmpR family regulator